MRDHLLCHELACRPRAAGFLGRALGSAPGPRVSHRGQTTGAGTLQAGLGCWIWFWPHNTKARKDGEHTLYTALGPGKGSLLRKCTARGRASPRTHGPSHTHKHTGNTPAPSLTLNTQGQAGAVDTDQYNKNNPRLESKDSPAIHRRVSSVSLETFLVLLWVHIFFISFTNSTPDISELTFH